MLFYKYMERPESETAPQSLSSYHQALEEISKQTIYNPQRTNLSNHLLNNSQISTVHHR